MDVKRIVGINESIFMSLDMDQVLDNKKNPHKVGFFSIL